MTIEELKNLKEAEHKVECTINTPIEESYIFMKINQHLANWGKPKMGKFVELFNGQLTRDQVKIFIYRLVKENYLAFEGNGPAREYQLSKNAKEGETLMKRAIEIGLETMKKNGEFASKNSNINDSN
jgi:hypothetical protein